MYKLQIFVFFIGLSFSSFAQKRCYTTEYINQKLTENPELVEKRNAYLNRLKALPKTTYIEKAVSQIVHIPVVFHIVYESVSQNVDDARIYEQIDRLNMDFSGTNADTALVPSEFKPFIADTKIRFYLATTDPDGNPSSGITRTQTSSSPFNISQDNIKKNADGGKDAWNTNTYLNIWVGNLEGPVLGYASGPFSVGENTDGVVINYLNIGNNSGGVFDKGRTATHEIGHYLGLDHIWGPGAESCILDDGLTDTPEQFGPNFGVNTHPLISCGSNDMFMNFMDYGNDESLVMFSLQQKIKMELILDGDRSDLGVVEPLSSYNEIKSNFKIFPNPTSGKIIVRFDNTFINGQITVFDISGKEYYSETINSLRIKGIDLSNLENGIYFVKVYNGNITTQKKMIVKK